MKFGQYLHKGFVAQAIYRNDTCLPRPLQRVDRAEVAPRQITNVITSTAINGAQVKIPVPVVVHSYATTGVQPTAQVVAFSTAYLILTDQGILPARLDTQGSFITPITQAQVGHKVSLQDTPIITDINQQVNRQKLQQSRNIHGVTEKMLLQHGSKDFKDNVKKHFKSCSLVVYDNCNFNMEPVLHFTYNIQFFTQNVLRKTLGHWFIPAMQELPIVYKKLRAMLAFSSICDEYAYGDWSKNLRCAGKMPLAVCLQQLGIQNTPQPSQLLSQCRVRQLISMLNLMYDIPIRLY